MFIITLHKRTWIYTYEEKDNKTNNTLKLLRKEVGKGFSSVLFSKYMVSSYNCELRTTHCKGYSRISKMIKNSWERKNYRNNKST